MKITIGTVSDNFEFDETLMLIKSSLLYADDVELIGMAEYAAYKFLPLQLRNAKNVDGFLDCFISLLKAVNKEQARAQLKELTALADAITPYKSLLQKKKHRTKNEILAQLKYKEYEKQCNVLMEEAIQNLIKEPAAKEIGDLIESHIISVFDYKQIGFDSDQFVGGYFANLLGTIKHRTSYPLFDRASNQVVSSVIPDKKLDLGEMDKEILRHAGVATNVLMTLPTLEGASIDEILDFKKGLQAPLDSFRSAIYRFSEQIESLPWDENFEYDCLKLYQTEVFPKVNEINVLASETSTLKNFGGRVLADEDWRRRAGYAVTGLTATITTGANLTKGIEVLENLIHQGATIGLSATGVAAFLKTADLLNKAHKETKEIKNQLKQNEMYYYYMANKRL